LTPPKFGGISICKVDGELFSVANEYKCVAIQYFTYFASDRIGRGDERAINAKRHNPESPPGNVQRIGLLPRYELR
jgi:hypothetical protein